MSRGFVRQCLTYRTDDWESPSSTDESHHSDPEEDFLSGLESLGELEKSPSSGRPLRKAPAKVHAPDPSPVKRPTKEQRAARRAERERRGDRQSVMLSHWGVWGWIVGGMIGGGIGAFIWAVVQVTTEYEFGFIAWGLGAAVGIGVRVASGNDYGTPLAVTAVILAMLSIVFARFLTLIFMTHDLLLSMVGVFLMALSGFMVTPYDLLWFALSGYTAYKFCMGDDD